MMDHGGLESVWPLHGSVLVINDTVYAVAGRSRHLDGGLRMVVLDAETGEPIAEHVLERFHPDTNEMFNDWDTVGLPDILSSDGRNVYMRSLVLDLQGRPRQPKAPRSRLPLRNLTRVPSPEELNLHIVPGNGFLDGSCFSRLLWNYGDTHRRAGRWQDVPSGQMLVVDGESVYGYGPKQGYGSPLHSRNYRLFRSPHLPETEGQGGQRQFKSDWEIDAPLYTRALVKTEDVLVAAGPLNPLDEGKPRVVYSQAKQEKREEALVALEHWHGKHGAKLLLLDPETGSLFRELHIDSLPVWDGLAAADGALYLACEDGSLICYGEPQ